VRIAAMLFDLSAKRAATLGLLSAFLSACPVLVATGDLAAQSSVPSDHVGPVVREVAQSAQAGDPAAPSQAGQGGAAVPSPSMELMEALSAAQAKLGELSRTAEAVGQLRQELQAALEQNQLLTSDLASAERKHEEAKVTIDQLRSRLVATEQRASELKATNASLSAELRAFHTAASKATDVALQNLKAITSRVETLNAVTSGAQGTSGPAAPVATRSEAGQGVSEGARAILEAPRPEQDLDANDQGSALAKANEPDQSIEEQAVGKPPVQSALGSDLVSALESKQKRQVEALLTDLKPVVERSGLLMTVPGSPLFRADSDEIEQTSYPTLAKVAELINIYRTHRVLIVGHTDASGEAAYNQMLSKRRADLVKRFLVDNFDIDAARLATEGKGEGAPIASNGTLAGREANRRVEVLLLN
jgi:outer membrane protein OmpA-like peptidoglycan-associated protein/HAMP domain-containing protein